jgi:putative ABC transport system permease protein
MKMYASKIPIAWRNLTHDFRQLLNYLAGIAFAVVLMFMQIGFLNAMLDSTVQLLHILDADIFLVNKITGSIFDNNEPFARNRVVQASGFPGTVSSSYLHIEDKQWKNPETLKTSSIRVLAFNPEENIFLNSEINSHQELLKKNNTVIVDRESKKHFGSISKGVVTELEGKTIAVAGNFTLGTDFAASGTLIMSDNNYLNLFSQNDSVVAERSRVELGLIKVEKNTDIPDLVKSMKKFYSKDVSVYPREVMIQKERDYWLENTPIGFVFGLGTVMGFIVGTIICYQILYTSIMDQMDQFATLKAIGYSNFYLFNVVLRQAALLSSLGFIPGLLISYYFYEFISKIVHLPMIMGESQIILVYVLTLAMSVISGLLAARKVTAADPAELF